MDPVYLDWAASAPPDPLIIDRSGRTAAELFANPSSPHSAGERARGLLAGLRGRLAGLLGCAAEEVVFTSGGTEANNMVLFSLLARGRGRRVVLSGIEHDSVAAPAERLAKLGGEAVFVPAQRDGRVDPDRILEAVDERTALVALMLVNNETGALQPVAEVASRLKELRLRSRRAVLLHTDAVQAFGKLPFAPAALGADTASLSAHKIGGPRGVGALYVRRDNAPEFLYAGGGQEAGRRPGTENLAGIAALVEAAEKAAAELERNLAQASELMTELVRGLGAIAGCRILPEARLRMPELFSPWILSTAFPPVPGEVLVRVMEEEGFLVSTGSACSSRKKERTRVLEAMGVPRPVASCAIRVSLGPATRKEDILGFVAALGRRLPGL